MIKLKLITSQKECWRRKVPALKVSSKFVRLACEFSGTVCRAKKKERRSGCDVKNSLDRRQPHHSVEIRK